MIPQFPEFKKLELSDRDEIEAITKDFLPYSDFNFTSLWCWDTHNKVEISILEQNLIIEFSDYITREQFLSFIGKNEINKSITLLREYIHRHGKTRSLKLIPAEVALRIENHTVIEDTDNTDYIVLADDLADLKGSINARKRNLINTFIKDNPSSYGEIINPFDYQADILNVFDKWAVSKMDEGVANERKAFKRFFDLPYSSHFICIGVFVQKKLIGYTINEKVERDFLIGHFCKADKILYKGAYSFLFFKSGEFIKKMGFNKINIEQDLGIEGLRKMKKGLVLDSLLKKHTLVFE